MGTSRAHLGMEVEVWPERPEGEVESKAFGPVRLERIARLTTQLSPLAIGRFSPSLPYLLAQK